MSVGLLLRQARESAGLSVEEVAALTRIRPQVIRDLEAGNLNSSGGIAYARGHIRAIAKVINADPDVLVAQFNEEAEHNSRPMIDLLAENSATPVKREKSEISYKKLSVAGIVLLALIIIIPAITSFFHSSPKSTKPLHATATASAHPSAAATPTATPTATSAATPIPTPTASATDSPAPTGTFVVASTVVFKAVNANSWFSVTDNSGTILWHGTLYKGAQQSFTLTGPINVTIGNAGAVDVTIDGKDAGLSGTIGQVVHIQYQPRS
jgi:cytoskeleton protein RodZ